MAYSLDRGQSKHDFPSIYSLEGRKKREKRQFPTQFAVFSIILFGRSLNIYYDKRELVID